MYEQYKAHIAYCKSLQMTEYRMKVKKLLELLAKEQIRYKILSLSSSFQAERAVREPGDLGDYPDSTVCVCAASYYEKKHADNKNILYFVLKNQTSLILDSSENLVELCGMIDADQLTAKINSFISRYQRIENAYSRIGQQLLEKQDVNGLIQVGSDLLGNPVVLLDISTKLLGCSSSEEVGKIDDELIHSVISQGFVTADLFYKYHYDVVLPEVGSLEKAKIYYMFYGSKLNRIVARIMVHNQYFGMIVVPESRNMFRPDDLKIADIIADALSFLLEKNHINPMRNPVETIFFDLLGQSYQTEEEVHMRCGGFNWKPSYPIRIIAIKVREGFPQSLLAYQNHLRLVMRTIISAVYNESLFLLAEEKELKQIFIVLRTFLQTNQLAAGVSQPFSRLLDVARYAEQASDILDIGSFLRPEDRIHRFEDYYFHYNAYLLKKSQRGDFFMAPELGIAQAYDQEYGTEYCKTVRVWIEYRNLVTAARAMNVHRNTIVYRLNKFQDITGIDLTSGDAIYRLHLTFYLDDLKTFEGCRG